jgi:hypothetical protein
VAGTAGHFLRFVAVAPYALRFPAPPVSTQYLDASDVGEAAMMAYADRLTVEALRGECAAD